MLSFMRRNRGGATGEGTESDSADAELGLGWIRKTLDAEQKLQQINALVSQAKGVPVGEAIFGESFYPPTRGSEGEEQLEAMLQEEAAKCVDTAISIFDDLSGWEAYGNTDGVQIYQKKIDKDLPVILKGEYVCLTAEEAASQANTITVDDLFQFLRNTENRGLYDSMFREGTILRRYDGSVLSYQVFSGMMGLPGREFIINGFDRHFDDGNRIIIAGCTPSEEALDSEMLSKMGIPSKSNGLVRAHCYMVGYDIRKYPDGSIKVMAISQPDLRGMIPQMIQKMVVTNHVVTLNKIANWIKQHKSLKNKAVPPPELFINHNCYLPAEAALEYYKEAIRTEYHKAIFMRQRRQKR